MRGNGNKTAGEQDDFTFDEDGDLSFDMPLDDSSPDDSVDGFDSQPLMKQSGGGGRMLSTRTGLLLLLLLAVGGGAYYYVFIMQPAMSTPPPPVRRSVSVKVTPPPSPAAPVETAAPVTAPPPPASPPETTTDASAATVATAPAVPAVAPAPQGTTASTPASASTLPKAAAAPVKPAPASMAAAEPVQSPAPPPPVKSGSVGTAGSRGGAYTLLAGAFATDEGLAEAKRQIRSLGYVPRYTPVRKPVTVTRLLVGYFSPEEAERRLRELTEDVPGAFTLKRGGQVALYATSHYNLDSAREFAGQLQQRGIRTVEETVAVEMTLTRVSYGSFETRAAAEQAATKARARGLEATVSRRPAAGPQTRR